VDDPDGKTWSANLQPLVDAIVERYRDSFRDKPTRFAQGSSKHGLRVGVLRLDYDEDAETVSFRL